MSRQLRSKIRNERAWWYKTIKSINYFCWRWWWVVVLGFTGFLLLYFLWLCPCRTAKECKERSFNSSLLDHCCTCQTPPPPPPPKLPDPPQPPKKDTIPTPKPKPKPKPPKIGKPCDAETKSGGAGVTPTKHNVGTKSGRITLRFDMDNVPDLLEVFYEGKRIKSTFEYPGNRGGYVGGDFGNKTGDLIFDYRHNKDDYVTVVVTGPDNTSWRYTLGCPE